MQTLCLKRVIQTSNVTLGILCSSDVILGNVLELPWKNNVSFESCIPAGTYRCEITNSAKYGKVYEVKGVLGRDHILIHYGNYVRNTDGCLLIGNGTMWDGGAQAIRDSKNTLKSFMTTMQGEPFDLVVKWV